MLLIERLHHILGQRGVGIVPQLAQHLDVLVLCLRDLHVGIGLLDAGGLAVQHRLVGVIFALQLVVDSVCSGDVVLTLCVANNVAQVAL